MKKHTVSIKKCILCIFLSSCSLQQYAQEFKGGVLGGITTSQIHGDGVGGFYKIGGTFGGFVQRDFSSKISGQFELRFSQKGSGDSHGSFKIHVGYVEMPVLVKYALPNNFTLFGGLGVGVRVYESLKTPGLKVKTNDFAPIDIPFYIGAEYHLSNALYFDVRSAYSLLPINYKYIHWCLYASIHVYIAHI